jgi:hypothetical protein
MSSGRDFSSSDAFNFPTGGGSDVDAAPFVIANPPSGGNDAATIQALIDANNPTGIGVILRSGTYLVNTELRPAVGYPLLLSGAPWNYPGAGGTTIRATAAIRSVLSILSSISHVSDLRIDANQQATYALYLNFSSLSVFSSVYATNAIKDGWFLDTSINDTSNLLNCWAVNNGTIYITAGIAGQHSLQRTSVIAGTATATNGSATITIVGGPDLTTLGIRKGDWIRTGSGALNASSTFAGQIDHWTATTVVLMGPAHPMLPNAAQAGSGLGYAIFIGDGWREVYGGSDNNINRIEGGIWRGNAGAAMSFHGLFGPTVIGTQADTNGFCAYAIGDADGIRRVFRSAFVRPYSEDDNGYCDFFFGDSSETTIISPTLGVGVNLGGGIAGGTVTADGLIIDGETISSITNGKLVKHLSSSLSANHAFATTALAVLAGMNRELVVEAGHTYEGTFKFMAANTVAADGMKMDFNGGSAAFASFFAGLNISVSSGTFPTIANNYGAGSTDVLAVSNSGNTGFSFYVVNLLFVVGAASGTFAPRFAVNSHSTGVLTIYGGTIAFSLQLVDVT